MNREKTNKIAIAADLSAPVVMLLGCVSYGAGIFGDSTLLQVAGFVLALMALLAIVAAMLAAIRSKQVALGLGALAGIAVCIAMVFFTAIAIGAGQHHPPRQVEAVADTVEVAGPAQHTELLDNRIDSNYIYN